MTSNKKKFIIPQLSVHGNVEEITEAGSALSMQDAPFGDDPNTPVGDVTS